MRTVPKTRENTMRSAKRWKQKYFDYQMKWHHYKDQQREEAANAVWNEMIIALETASYLFKQAEKLPH